MEDLQGIETQVDEAMAKFDRELFSKKEEMIATLTKLNEVNEFQERTITDKLDQYGASGMPVPESREKRRIYVKLSVLTQKLQSLKATTKAIDALLSPLVSEVYEEETREDEKLQPIFANVASRSSEMEFQQPSAPPSQPSHSFQQPSHNFNHHHHEDHGSTSSDESNVFRSVPSSYPSSYPSFSR